MNNASYLAKDLDETDKSYDSSSNQQEVPEFQVVTGLAPAPSYAADDFSSEIGSKDVASGASPVTNCSLKMVAIISCVVLLVAGAIVAIVVALRVLFRALKPRRSRTTAALRDLKAKFA